MPTSDCRVSTNEDQGRWSGRDAEIVLFDLARKRAVARESGDPLTPTLLTATSSPPLEPYQESHQARDDPVQLIFSKDPEVLHAIKNNNDYRLVQKVFHFLAHPLLSPTN